MKWSWHVGRIAGIDVYIHATFVILLAWVALLHYQQRHLAADAVRGIVFILAIFGIVVLHELGHALAARRYGIQTRDITLWPIGGVARLERMPREPRQELVVALAGPAVNVAIAAICAGVLWIMGSLESMRGVDIAGGSFLANLMWVNVALAVFNLLPAFPMDGGRVLRAILAMNMDYTRATQTAAALGQATAFLFGVLGLFLGQPFLVFIAFFVWMAAAQEANIVQIQEALGGIPVSRAMITNYRVLAPTDTLNRAVEHILDGFQEDFPVVEDDHVVGVLTRADLLAALSNRDRETPVADVMRKDFLTAEPGEMLERVFDRLRECACHSLPVLHSGRLVGMMTTENLGEYLMIQAAIRGRQPVAAQS